MRMMTSEECCGTCRYNRRDWSGEYCCGCEASEAFGLSTAYDDTCEAWEEKEG